jgi:monoamine oxidase|tara:strand:+ start:1532 stop:1735 length:204 start_codon:yes stop_codon:yes gene_type:complete
LKHRKPISIAHVAGQQARDLAASGPKNMTDFAIQNLRAVFGSHFSKLIRGIVAINRQNAPFIKGGYS